MNAPRYQKQVLLFLTLAAVASWALYFVVSQPPGRQATLQGQIVCLGCELAKQPELKGEVDCKRFGHVWILKATDGKFYHFLRSKVADKVVGDENLHGKGVRIDGLLFEDGNAIEVKSYRPLPELPEMAWAVGKPKPFKASGRLSCPGCSMGAMEAGASCVVYTCRRSLLSEDGKIYHLLRTKKSEQLLTDKKLLNKDVAIEGKLLSEAKLVVVEGYRLRQGEKSQ